MRDLIWLSGAQMRRIEPLLSGWRTGGFGGAAVIEWIGKVKTAKVTKYYTNNSEAQQWLKAAEFRHIYGYS